MRAILIDRGIGLYRHSLLREPAEGVEAGVARRPAALAASRDRARQSFSALSW
jgi:hypothetical protein